MALDNFRTIELIWDKASKSIIKTIKTASSDTTGRYLSVKILDGGQEVTLNNAKLQLYWEHPNFNTSGTDDFNTINNGGLFKMTFSDEMLTNIGKLNAHLILTLPDGKITSNGFTIEVIKGANDGVVVPTNGAGLVKQIDGKIDKGNVTLNDLTQEVKLALTGGAVAIVGADAVGTENIKDSSVTAEKTDFFGMGKNLFNKFSVESGKRVNASTGELFNVAGVSTSNFIEVSPSTSYHRNFTEAYAIYTSAGTFIIGGNSEIANKVINVPENGAKIKLTVKNENLDTFQFEKGTSGTEYEMYKGVLSEIVRIKEKSLPEINLDMTNFGHVTSATANLVNPQEVEEGLINSDGSITTPHVAYSLTGFIYVKDASTVTVTGTRTGVGVVRRSYAFYDRNKNFLSGYDGSSGGFTNPLNIPDGAYFARFSFDSSCPDYQVEVGSVATPYIAFEPKEEIVPFALPKINEDTTTTGKKLVTNGDSITYGTTGTIPFTGGNYDNQVPWPLFVAQTLKMGLSNHAIGGSTIAVKESSQTERDPIVTRYESMADGDVIIIAGGSNDWQYSWTPLGDMTSRTNYTFYGALHNLCLGLLEKYKGKQIVFTTPIKRGQLPQESTNANGKTLAEYGQIIKQVCGYYGIPVIDMYNECTINPHIDTQRSEFIPDTVHPNRSGHELMAKRIGGYLRQLA